MTLNDFDANNGELWITNNGNYEQYTFNVNQTTYDFDFIDVVGQRISFWVQSLTGERLAEKTMLIEPPEPKITITCGTNCENNMVTVKWSNLDYDNITIVQYIDDGDILLSQELINPASQTSTFFTYQPGRLERFEALGIKNGLNATTILRNRVSPLPLDLFDYTRSSVTNSSVNVFWEYARKASHFDYVEISSSPPNVIPNGPIKIPKDQTNFTLTNLTTSFITLMATTKTNDPIEKASMPKMTSLYLVPLRIDPSKLRVTSAVNLDGFSVSWPKPRSGTISEYRLSVQLAKIRPETIKEAKAIASSKTGFQIGGLTPGHVYRIQLWTIKEWEQSQLISEPTVHYALLGPAKVKSVQPVEIRTSTRSMQFQWEAAEGTYTGYNISWSSTSDCFEQNSDYQFYDVDTAKRSEKMGIQVYKLDGLQPNCDYKFNITTFLDQTETFGLNSSLFTSEVVTATGNYVRMCENVIFTTQ